MLSKGIRILDKAFSVSLKDILCEVENGESLYWSILFFDGIGRLKIGLSITELEKEIKESKDGFFISWNDLISLEDCMHQIIEILIIGSTELNLITKYANEQNMYESCDIVIEMVDSSYWEVFSKDERLIDKLKKKFKKIECLETDFLNKKQT